VNEKRLLASEKAIADRQTALFRHRFAQLLAKVAVNAVQLLPKTTTFCTTLAS